MITSSIKAELRPLLRLAIPVILAEIGWILLGIVDIVMVGRVSAAAIGAVSIGNSIYVMVSLFGLGLLLGLDYLVAHAYGAGELDECHRWLLHGLYLACAVGVVLFGVVVLSIRLLFMIGLDPAVVPMAVDYLRIANYSVPPLLLFTALRRYLQAINIVNPIMFALFAANVVNALANWIFVFGHWGAPALGAAGAAYATVFSKTFMALALGGYLALRERRNHTGLFEISLRPEFSRFAKMLRLGLPIGTQILLEVGVFATATLLAGRINAVALAAHQIALKIAGFAFMIPLGVSAAGAVRVGQWLGGEKPANAARAGWLALAFGVGFMCFSGALFVSFPQFFMRLFTPDSRVIALGVSLLYLAALFQIFDGSQIVGAGVLRGTGDTRTPMIWNLVAHWFIGLPVGYTLCFIAGWGVRGLWVGLTLGLVVVAAALVRRWRKSVGEMREQTHITNFEIRSSE